MKRGFLSSKRLFQCVTAGMLSAMAVITISVFLATKQTAVLIAGGALSACALICLTVLTQTFGKRLARFTS